MGWQQKLALYLGKKLKGLLQEEKTWFNSLPIFRLLPIFFSPPLFVEEDFEYIELAVVKLIEISNVKEDHEREVKRLAADLTLGNDKTPHPLVAHYFELLTTLIAPLQKYIMHFQYSDENHFEIVSPNDKKFKAKFQQELITFFMMQYFMVEVEKITVQYRFSIQTPADAFPKAPFEALQQWILVKLDLLHSDLLQTSKGAFDKPLADLNILVQVLLTDFTHFEDTEISKNAVPQKEVTALYANLKAGLEQKKSAFPPELKDQKEHAEVTAGGGLQASMLEKDAAIRSLRDEIAALHATLAKPTATAAAAATAAEAPAAAVTPVYIAAANAAMAAVSATFAVPAAAIATTSAAAPNEPHKMVLSDSIDSGVFSDANSACSLPLAPAS